MRLQSILPRVEPAAITLPSLCPHEGCDGTHFQFLQEVDKPLRDTRYPKVVAHPESMAAPDTLRHLARPRWRDPGWAGCGSAYPGRAGAVRPVDA